MLTKKENKYCFQGKQYTKKGNLASESLPVKHAQGMTFLQQLLNIPLMQGSSNNQNNVINHVTVPGTGKEYKKFTKSMSQR